MKDPHGNALDLTLCPKCDSKPSLKCTFFSNKYGASSRCKQGNICPITCNGNRRRKFICQSLKGTTIVSISSIQMLYNMVTKYNFKKYDTKFVVLEFKKDDKLHKFAGI